MISILLDTDVCLDSITGREPWNANADRIFHASVEKEVYIFISGLTFSNLYYLLRKIHGSRKTIKRLRAMRDLIKVSPINSKVVDQAFDSSWNDFEDAMQYHSALKAGCDLLVTRNLSDYKKADRIPVIQPSGFIEQHLKR
mgnify:CR=1 FL=1